MEVIGKLKAVNPIEKVSDRFKKREFVLTTDSATPYPQHVLFQLTQDKCEIIDRFKIGDELQVQFNLRGREWNGQNGLKYFNTLEAWKVVNLPAEYNHAARRASEPEQDLPF